MLANILLHAGSLIMLFLLVDIFILRLEMIRTSWIIIKAVATSICNIGFAIGCIFQGACYGFRKFCVGPEYISVQNIWINQALVIDKVLIQGCPPSITIYKNNNRTIEVCMNLLGEPCYWHNMSCISFKIGMSTGRIHAVYVRYEMIRKFGANLRIGFGNTDWEKYFSSVVMAHIEVLKFSQWKKNRHPILISKIFKVYAEDIFQEAA